MFEKFKDIKSFSLVYSINFEKYFSVLIFESRHSLDDVVNLQSILVTEIESFNQINKLKLADQKKKKKIYLKYLR